MHFFFMWFSGVKPLRIQNMGTIIAEVATVKKK